MAHSIKYDAVKKIVTTTVIDLIKISTTLNIFRDMVQVGREYNCRLFVLNADEAVVNDNFIEVYALFDDLELYLRKGTDKLAIVHKRQRHIFNLIDSIAINHGFMLKSFNDNNKAIRWLNFKISPNYHKYK